MSARRLMMNTVNSFVDPRSGKTNYLTDQLNFTGAAWQRNSITVIANQTIIAPDGSNTATQLKGTSANSYPLSIINSLPDGNYQFSAYMKKGRTTADNLNLCELYNSGSS